MPDTLWKNRLRQLFESTLEVDAEKRFQHLEHGSKSGFEFITDLLGDHSSIVSRASSIGDASDVMGHSSPATSFPSASSFLVGRSLQSLCQADFRVREYVFHCLNEYTIRPKKSLNIDQKTSCMNKTNIAIQLAFCKNIGFGTDQDDGQAKRYLDEAREWQRRSGISQPIPETCLQLQIELSRTVQEHSSQWLKELYDTGVIQPIHQGIEFLSSAPDERQKISEARKKEIDIMEKELGATHPAVLGLKWSLSTLLSEGPDPVALIELMHEMVKSLEADKDRKPNDRELALAKAYRAMSLTTPLLPPDDITMEHVKQADIDLARIGAHDHVVAFFVCSSFSEYLEQWGQYTASDAFLQRAKMGMMRIFGPDHPNTVAVLEKETGRWIRRGNTLKAIEVVKDSIQRMEELVGRDDMAMGIVRSKLADLLIMVDEYDEADKVIKETNQRFAKNFDQTHPAIVVPMTTVAMLKERYEEVCQIQEKVLRIIVDESKPWPPPEDEDPIRIISRSPALRELSGKDENWVPPTMQINPNVFTVNPGILGTLATLGIAMHAQAEVESHQNNTRKARLLRKKANSHMSQLMKHINDSLGPDPWNGLDEMGGIEGSAMRRVMDEERTLLLELLAYAGDDGRRKGLHYETAIAVAPQYPKITALLKEHRALCTTEINDTTPMFRDGNELATWLTADWKGAYLYRASTPRMDPKGHVTLNLRATPTEGQHDHHVELLGSGTEELGGITIKGKAYKSGKIRWRLCMAGNDEDDGWEYVGVVDLRRKAFGGFWGYPDAPRNKCEGTFLLQVQ
ncbi:hypothetical protein F4861DRAFT_551859 [Xylaria intraflava]|nr:hypothetical protein F4861DRAFT_551859 [Xylaria intraflava]